MERYYTLKQTFEATGISPQNIYIICQRTGIKRSVHGRISEKDYLFLVELAPIYDLLSAKGRRAVYEGEYKLIKC